MEKIYGNSLEVFVNQDEGMFVALPITYDENALILETETRNGRKFVKAGSIVLREDGDKTYARGITAEEFEITNGPVVGRVVVEGYAWAERLTANAIAYAKVLPRIVLFPVNAEIEVEPIVDYFKLTLPVGVTSDADDNNAIEDGTTVTLTVTPEEGYELDELFVDGIDVAGSVVENEYEFAIVKDTVVTVTFKLEG